MASITIGNLDDIIEQQLRIRAAEHGRSMEEEARDILSAAVGEGRATRNLAAAIRARITSVGPVDLELPQTEAMREPPAFDGQ